ncbi:MAG TPA: proline iminopeptidase-family hydrolase, partial [Gemmatimonadales bacterium]|nr:proline iminopeptidase-family hydrolase [Gemmatimonadales bacterium]
LLAGCADLKDLGKLQQGLAANFHTSGVAIDLANGNALTVTFVNLAVSDSDRPSLCRQAAEFVRDHYAGYDHLRTVAVGFKRQIGIAGFSASRSTVPCQYTTAELATPLTPHEAMLTVPGGGRIWYRVAGTGPGTPVIVIHGGPGSTSCGLTPFTALGNDRPVILYDQLGTGRSDRPADTTYWNLPHFVAELQTLRDSLGLSRVDLLGHSWGTAVAMEYALTHPNSGVEALVLAGPFLSTPRWIEDADSLVGDLPDSLQRIIARADSAGNYDSPRYAAAVNAYYAQHLSITNHPRPACEGVRGNDRMYRAMWGPSEFRSTGTLRTYDRSDRLGELKLPVLLLGGQYDEAPPSRLRWYQVRIPGSEIAVIPGAAHAEVRDNPDSTIAAVRAFLRRADQH